MAKLTIAQLREKEVKTLATYDKRCISEYEAEATAKKIMNRFYRLNALSMRNLEDDNDERTCNKFWHKQNEEKEMRLIKALDSDLEKIYGLNLAYAGVYATIAIKDGTRIERDIIYGHYYN